ncbi:hypothetical protein ABGB12_22595 [Actinocorallia sp. B10E7]|uniref:hypothetical protein n=1 Tax=Actinocorallia sp. B10E7 TaxID=3153558 RepID=UPI00325CDE51
MTPDEPEATRRDLPPDVTCQDPGGPRRPLDAPSYGEAVTPPAGSAEDLRIRLGTGRAEPGMWDPSTVTRARRRSRSVSWAGVLVSLAVVGGVLYWIQAREQAALRVTKVVVEAPEGVLACDRATRSRTVRLTATLTLDGGSGEVRYRWRQSDSGPGPLAVAKVPAGQKALVVPLNWHVSGSGRARLTGTFELSSPAAQEASASFEYSCR